MVALATDLAACRAIVTATSVTSAPRASTRSTRIIYRLLPWALAVSLATCVTPGHSPQLPKASVPRTAPIEAIATHPRNCVIAILGFPARSASPTYVRPLALGTGLASPTAASATMDTLELIAQQGIARRTARVMDSAAMALAFVSLGFMALHVE